MKVLIIYPWIHHSRMIEELTHRLSEKGIIADAICIGYAALHKNDNNKIDIADEFEFG